jgi:uncharacterized protein
MKVNLSNLINGSDYQIELDDTFEINEIKTEGNHIKFNKPVEVNGGIFNTDDGIYLQAKVSFEYTTSRARCLKNITKNEDAMLDYKIVYENDQENSSEDELILEKGNILNLNEPIISSILLSLPMKTICDNECKGICPQCGKDLNKGDCNCEDDNIDPRLAKLKRLMDK